jgi:hypothetical protein
MSEKQVVLTRLAGEMERWEALLASLGEGQVTAPNLPGGWSIKDVVAHLRAWQQRSVARMEAALQAREPVFPAWPADLDPEQEGQPHALNDWLYQTSRDKPWPAVHQEWREGFGRLLELGAALPEADLLEPGKFAWLEGQALSLVLEASAEHHAEHWEWLLAWLREHDLTA